MAASGLTPSGLTPSRPTPLLAYPLWARPLATPRRPRHVAADTRSNPMSGNKAKVAVLDDWQGVARQSADWSALESRAEVTIFADAFRDEDDAASKLADFDI